MMHYINLIGKIILISTLVTACSSLPTEIPNDENLVVQEEADYILMYPRFTSQDLPGIVFYPGGLVDPHAYMNMFKTLVTEHERPVMIIKAQANLAIINSQKASSILQNSNISNRWIIGGHSLGGSVACMDIFNNPNTFKALFLLASYSVDDLSEINIPIISITGSNDLVLNKEAFDENASNLPTGITINSPEDIPDSETIGTTIYYEIEGANHAQFGDYGNQNGDGTASIDSKRQQELVIESLLRFFESNQL